MDTVLASSLILAGALVAALAFYFRRRIGSGILRPIPVLASRDAWRARELSRFETGEYVNVPWYAKTWWIGSTPAREHYAHVSIDDPAKLAYTASPERGRADRQNRIRPARYLAKYFPEVSYPVRAHAAADMIDPGRKREAGQTL